MSTHLTRDQRIQRVLRDLDWGYSDNAIMRRNGMTRVTVLKYRRLWNSAWWAARDRKRMTPRSSAGADIERGVGSPVERGT